VAFPDFKNLPAIAAERLPIAFVTLHIPAALFSPEADVGGRNRLAVFAAMHVPEAAVNKENRSGRGKDKIRLSRQIRPMQPVAKSEAVEYPPYPHLGQRIAASDARHIEAALLLRMDIGHVNTIAIMEVESDHRQ
jgi:hypothetical protein